jgi:putative transposase
MGTDKELIDKILGDYKGPEDLIGEQGLLKELTRALLEHAMHAELTHHLGYEKHAPDGKGSGNSRDGTSAKTLKGDFGEVEIEVPRDRQGNFEPKIAPRHQRRFNGFDDKILSMVRDSPEAPWPRASTYDIPSLVRPPITMSSPMLVPFIMTRPAPI